MISVCSKVPSLGALHAEVGLQRQVDLHALGHVEERAAGPDRAVQRRELVVLRRDALLHEVLLHQLGVLRDRGVHRAEEDPEVGVLLLEALVDGLLAPDADDAGEVLALGLGDAEVLVGLLHVRRDVVPGVVAAGLGRAVEHQLVEVQVGQVDAPGGDGLALEDLEGLDAQVAHPLGLALDLGQLLDDLARDALLGDQLALLVLDDRAGLLDSGLVNSGHVSIRSRGFGSVGEILPRRSDIPSLASAPVSPRARRRRRMVAPRMTLRFSRAHLRRVAEMSIPSCSIIHSAEARDLLELHPDVLVGRDRGRGLRDRAALAVEAQLGDLAVLVHADVHAHLVPAEGVVVVELQVVRDPAPEVPGVLVVVEDVIPVERVHALRG